MNTITRSHHGLLDYLMGAILLVSPLLLTFPDNQTKAVAIVFVAAGHV